MLQLKDILTIERTDRHNRDLMVETICAYDINLFDSEVVQERFPIDALVFAEHQTPYLTVEEYREKRCTYDEETNEWLEHYTREMAKNVHLLPPILVHLTDTGVALVDGVHRTSALLMFTNDIRINAWVIR